MMIIKYPLSKFCQFLAKCRCMVKDTFVYDDNMNKKLTQEEVESRSLKIGIRMVGKYLGSSIKTEFECPLCQKIFSTVPTNIWSKHSKSCGCLIDKIKYNRRYTQLMAEQKSLDVGVKMIGQYRGCDVKTTFVCPRCYNIFVTTPYFIWSKNTCSCGCLRIQISSATLKNPIITTKRIKTRKIPKNGNSLAEKFPKIAKEWHPTKNENRTPLNVHYGTNDKVWWLGQCGHEWEMRIVSRTDGKQNCPYCVGKKTLIGFNDLLSQKPQLCEEWDYVKNIKGPKYYTKGSHYKAHWVCSKCQHTWQTSIDKRTTIHGTNCPKCNKSKGENKIMEILNHYNIKYNIQKRFDSCRNKNPLPFDFYLPKHNICIEYQGEQHYNGYQGYFKQSAHRTQQHDKIKRKYCRDNNIKLIEIKYTDFNHIANILQKELNLNKENK